MLTLRSQNGCWKCRHVFQYHGYEEGPHYYCTLNAPPRPLCGSGAMGEQWRHGTEEFGEDMDKWEEWSGKRGVMPWCICDSFADNPEVEHIVVEDPHGYLAD